MIWCYTAITQIEVVTCEEPANQEMADTSLVDSNLINNTDSSDLSDDERISPTELTQQVNASDARRPAVASCHAKSFLEIVYGDFCAVRDSSQGLYDEDGREHEVTSVTRRIVCVEKTHSTSAVQNDVAAVQLFNSSQLLTHLGSRANTSVFGRCTVVLFYAPWCMFCVRLAPHYNALARAFPTLHVIAIDAYQFSR